MKRLYGFAALLRARTVLIGAISFGIVSARVYAAPPLPDVQTTNERAEAHGICDRIIHVRPGDALFRDCALSLEASLQSANHARAVSQARDACFAQSRKLDGVNLQLCLLRAADAKPGADDMQLLSTAPGGTNDETDPEPTRSFYAASHDTDVSREQRACALVGFDPAFAAFARCVSDLRDALDTGTAGGG